MSENSNIHIDRLHKCTFEQTLELTQHGWEGYREEMSRYFPLMGPSRQAVSTEANAGQESKKPSASALDRLLGRFGPDGIRAEQSIVAFVDDQPVGYVFIAIKVVNGKKLAWNGGTAVLPEYRGLGLAKAMMREALDALREQEVDRAYLEVVVYNDRAISAYINGGFHIVDRVTGMRCTEQLHRPFHEGNRTEDIELRYGKPEEVAHLPFYREDAAWECMWHGIGEGGESLIAHDATGDAVAYALFKRSEGAAAGEYKSVTLYQCEASPSWADQSLLFRLLLSEVFGNPGIPCNRTTANLSMSHPELISLLREAGFVTVHEQYLMILEPRIEKKPSFL